MTNDTYIPIPRSFFQNPIWKERRTFTKAEALTYLYANAAYAPYQKMVDGKLVDVRTGEVVDSLRYLAEAWGWAKSTVSDFLKKLQTQKIITLETRTGINAITVTFSATYYTEAAKDRTATGQQPDSNRTATGQQPDKGEEDKENKEEKEGKVGATPAPLFSKSDLEQYSAPILPGTEGFELLKRIGQTAADMWVKSGIKNTFQTSHHADLALEWMQYCCDRKKPFASHMELVDLVGQFNRHTLAECKEIMDYSVGRKYTALFFDRLQKKTPSRGQGVQHKPEIIQKDRFETERQNAQPNGLIKFN